jgi:Xaa-Pro dipeptidase
MVVTVEPGIYFSVYALQHFYLPSPIHSKYINVDVLQRYLPVGGARIEDDVLITSKGYENLTTAPKGDAMLEIIRHGKSNRTAVSDPKPVSTSRRRSVEVEPPLVRAPGISNSMSQPIQRPLARAATMPAEFKQQEDVDFEPFAGPSLFSNFTRSMTTEEKIQQWRQKRDPVPATQSTPPTVKQLHPVCGEPTRNVQHVYLSNASSLASLSQSAPEFESPAMCKNCVILVQTLDRLRQNLTAPGQSSPKLQIEPVFEATVEARNRFTKDEGHAKELHTGESARTMRLQRELPIRNSVAPHAGPIQTATQFSTKYTPSQVSQPVSSRNPFKPTSPLRVQPASGTEHVTSRHLGRRTTDHSSTAQRRNPARLPVPSALAPASDTRDSLHKYEALRLRLEALEEGARVRAQRQEHPTRSHRPPMSRPSMPNLMSHNPWQQHDTQLVQEPHNPFQARSSQNSPQRHNLRSQVSRMNTSNMRPAAPTNKRSVNLEALMVDGERIDQREREQRQERLQHEALRRNRYFTR